MNFLSNYLITEINNDIRVIKLITKILMIFFIFLHFYNFINKYASTSIEIKYGLSLNIIIYYFCQKRFFFTFTKMKYDLLFD